MGLDDTLEVVDNHIHLFIYDYSREEIDGKVVYTGLGVSNGLESIIQIEDSVVTFIHGDNSFTIQGEDKNELDLEFICHKSHVLSKVFVNHTDRKFSNQPKVEDEEEFTNKKFKSLSSKRQNSLKSMGIVGVTETESKPSKPKKMDLETFKSIHRDEKVEKQPEKTNVQKSKFGKWEDITLEDIEKYITEITTKDEPDLPYLPKPVYMSLLRVKHVYNKNLYTPEEWEVYKETIKTNILNSCKRRKK